MISYESPHRICDADTDRTGIMYYSNYPRLYEIGRTDMIRTIIKEIPKVKFRLVSEIYNEKMELIND